MSTLTVAGSALAAGVLFLSGGSGPPPPGEAAPARPSSVYSPSPEGTGSAPSPGAGVITPLPGSPFPVKPRATAQPAPTLLVPDVRGADGQTAKNRLESAGFYSVRMVSVDDGGAVPDPAGWRVVNQAPDPGNAAESTRQITLQMIRIPSF
ncbi:hypothetical protein GCM10010156_05680 [Planobispora rosea]|uniref:PASTA domain-containing protein n=2 Tax=Planobispora rosea TaxID=35762 RepID=A0A8J3WCH7_PLARO|nr:PASTA domain-containing protein [Planobispora rosea]GGS49847.1 hypothetical protein GCM10010156_05680 [Planobispora rosea]GIH83852.1 hypothetical protein Pro02_22600 [Planobispora rosea]